jgi:hypothetical protein
MRKVKLRSKKLGVGSCRINFIKYNLNMTNIKGYRDLIVYQKAYYLAIEVCEIS